MSIAIITGASSGIGAQFARELHKLAGIDEFWFIARRTERMEALRYELGVEAKIIGADLTTKEGIDKLRTALEEEKPVVRFLVNCAGFGNFGRFDEIPESDVEAMIDLNVKASVLITHMTVPYIERGGRIIELGSGSCFTPLPAFNVYSSSKVFILHYTKALNYELEKYGIRATCFCPGWVDTEFIGKATARNNVTEPKAMKPMLGVEDVVRGCVKASIKGKTMYVTNWYTKLQHLLFKILPDWILTRLWLGMLKSPEKKEVPGEVSEIREAEKMAGGEENNEETSNSDTSVEVVKEENEWGTIEVSEACENEQGGEVIEEQSPKTGVEEGENGKA